MTIDSPLTSDSRRPLFTVSRLASLSDGVFSIAMTLLVLTINLPTHTTIDNLGKEILSLGHDYLAYVLSFMVIGMFWSWHHAFVERIRIITQQVVNINLWFLLLIAFLPFPTSVVSDYASTTTGTLFYLASLGSVGLARLVFIEYVIRSATYHDDVPRREIEHQRWNSIIFVAILVISCGLSFWNPDVALFSLFLLYPANYIGHRL